MSIKRQLIFHASSSMKLASHSSHFMSNKTAHDSFRNVTERSNTDLWVELWEHFRAEYVLCHFCVNFRRVGFVQFTHSYLSVDDLIVLGRITRLHILGGSIMCASVIMLGIKWRLLTCKGVTSEVVGGPGIMHAPRPLVTQLHRVLKDRRPGPCACPLGPWSASPCPEAPSVPTPPVTTRPPVAPRSLTSLSPYPAQINALPRRATVAARQMQ